MGTILGFNPMAVTNAAGFFGVQSDGFTQGVAHDDPAVRYQLAGGVLLSTETLPMWGGIAISEYLPLSTNNGHNGPGIGRATTNAGITGFSVFNQSHNAINSPENQVPILASGMSVNFYRFGSLARIPLAADPTLVASLASGLVTQAVSWDINNQRLQTYDASTPTYAVTSITSSYSASTGLYTFVVVMGVASLVGAVGDTINISGVTGTGAALVNGNQTVTAFTNNENFSFQVAAASGAIATGSLTGTILLNAGVGALPCKILQLGLGNSRIVGWNPVISNANWINNQSCILVQI
jgi:hypothetical protein